jgi:NAD(P)-dependent dehydrogenase (short-subunit alcohol dehydrogenase family)
MGRLELGCITMRAERSRTVGDHRGTTFVVTGGTSGIGAAAALALAGAGANVIIIGPHEARGRRLLTRLGRRRGRRPHVVAHALRRVRTGLGPGVGPAWSVIQP